MCKGKGKRRRAGAGKSPPLDQPAAAAAEVGSGGGNGAVTNPSGEAGPAPAQAVRNKRCKHVLCEQDDIDMAKTGIRFSDEDPTCSASKCAAAGESNILVCLDCEMRFCYKHAYSHASDARHWVHLCCEKLSIAFCYKCKISFDISGNEGEGEMEVDKDDFFVSFRKKNEGGWMVDNEAGGHVSGLADDGHAHAIKGIPNLGNTCYLNSLVQCLLVLGKLRESMLGPDAPTELIGVALRHLFEDAGNVNNTGGLLDPNLLLACVRSLDTQFEGASMHDSHEVFCRLRDGLDVKRKPPNMHDSASSAVAPTVIDSIFGGQLLVTTSCKCCLFKSVSHDVFHDISVPLPPKVSPAKSVEVKSPPKGLRSRRLRSRRKIHIKLFPESDESKKAKNHTIAEGGCSRSPASELEDVVLVRTSEPLKVDSTKVEQISQSRDSVHAPLQTQKKAQGQMIQVPIKAVDFLPQNMLFDVKVQAMDVTEADSRIPEFVCPPTPDCQMRKENARKVSGSDIEENESAALDNVFCPPTPDSQMRKENARKVSGNDIEENESAALDNVFNKHEVCAEAKRNTSSAEVISEEKGKSESSDIVYNRDEDINYLASIEDCLELHFKVELIEWTCGNCSMVAQKPDVILDKYNEPMMSNTNEDTTVDGDQTEQSEKITCQSEQSSKLNSLTTEATSSSRQTHGSDSQHHSADQMEENQSGQKDSDKGAIQTRLISKLPPVLAIHLKRSLGPHKLTGHVSFKEILDVGLFMEPSSEDKDNSRYRLVGVVEHRGLGIDAGHYVAYVRASPRQQTSGSSSWFLANDDIIKEISFEEVLKCEAYLLFYERMET